MKFDKINSHCALVPPLSLLKALKPLTAVLAAMLSPAVAFSAPPIAFGSSGCPAGFVCEDNVVSTGMVQRLITDTAGVSYYQVSISDGVTNNGGSFVYESFVNATNGNTLGGISAKLDILQTGVENINYSTTLNLGWANTSGPAIDFALTVTDSTYQTADLDYTFSYKQNQDGSRGTTGYYYDISQRVVNQSGTGTNDISNFVLRRAGGDFVSAGSITFSGGGGGGGGGMKAGGMKASVGAPTTSTGVSASATASVQSTFTPNAGGYGTNGTSSGTIGDSQTEPAAGTVYDQSANPHFLDNFAADVSNATDSAVESNTQNSVTTTAWSTGGSVGVASGADAPTSEVYVATGSSMGMSSGGPGGGTVSWNAGDEIQVLWIGQECPGCSGPGGGTQPFSFQQYENLTSGSLAAKRSISSSTPLNWVSDPFGLQPSL